MIQTKVVIRRKDRIEFILSGLCDYYKINRETLLSVRARTPESYKRKGITIKLLRDIADLSLKEISSIFTFGDEGTSWRIYQDVIEDREYNSIIKFMGL